MMRFPSFLVLLFILVTGFTFSQEINFKTSHDSTKYLVGDEINLHISAEYPERYKMQLPSRLDTLKPLEFVYIDTVSLEKANSRISARFRYVIMGFDSGLYKVPSLDFAFVSGNNTSVLKSDSFFVLVSTIAVDTSEAIKDIKALNKIPFDYSFLYWLIPLLIVVGLVLYKLWQYWKRRKSGVTEVEKIPELPPYEEAVAALRKLEAQKLWQNGQVKEFHSEITGIIRNFFEREYNFPALESTSTETINDLRNIGVPASMIVCVEDFLSNADMVKFAKFVPLTEINQKMISSAYEILDYSKSAQGETKA